MIATPSAFKLEYLKNKKRFLETVFWKLFVDTYKTAFLALSAKQMIFLEMLPILSANFFITCMHICDMSHSAFLFDQF